MLLAHLQRFNHLTKKNLHIFGQFSSSGGDESLKLTRSLAVNHNNKIARARQVLGGLDPHAVPVHTSFRLMRGRHYEISLSLIVHPVAHTPLCCWWAISRSVVLAE